MAAVAVLVETILVNLVDLVVVEMVDMELLVDRPHTHQHKVMLVEMEVVILDILLRYMAAEVAVVLAAQDGMHKYHQQQTLQDLVDLEFNFQQRSKIQHQRQVQLVVV